MVERNIPKWDLSHTGHEDVEHKRRRSRRN